MISEDRQYKEVEENGIDRQQLIAKADSLTERYVNWLSFSSNKPAIKALFVFKVLACAVIAVPDAMTYHAYAQKNGEKIQDFMLNATNTTAVEGFSDVASFWCAYGAPTGVYLFAFNNVLRWAAILGETLVMSKSYHRRPIRWTLYGLTAILAGVSVIPFYGMAKGAQLDEFFCIANSVARFCMDHYSWYELTSFFLDNKIKVKAKDVPGFIAFALGFITATYLYPFARDVSGPVLAAFAVAPTCILWGLDSRFSWNKIFEFFYNQTKRLYGVCCKQKQLPEDDGSYDPPVLAGLVVVLAVLYVIVSAGALSETITATENAAAIGYPALFMEIVAGIAFTGIYLAGPTQLAQSLFQFLQAQLQTEKGEAMGEKIKDDYRESFLGKLGANKVICCGAGVKKRSRSVNPGPDRGENYGSTGGTKFDASEDPRGGLLK